MGFLLQITHSYPVFKGHVIWLPQKCWCSRENVFLSFYKLFVTNSKHVNYFRGSSELLLKIVRVNN